MFSVCANLSAYCRRSVGASIPAIVSRRHTQCPVGNLFCSHLVCGVHVFNRMYLVSCISSGSRCKYSSDCFHTRSKYRVYFGLEPKRAMPYIVSHMRPDSYHAMGGYIRIVFISWLLGTNLWHYGKGNRYRRTPVEG